MSTLKAEIVAIESINVHPNAERLELATIKGWNVVVGKGRYKPGDACVYIPIDSVLPHELEEKLFPPDAKVKLSKSRVKTIKLRGAVSQGMIAPLEILPNEKFALGADVTGILGITKYEPPAPGFQTSGEARPARLSNPNFSKYTDIENFKNYNKLFAPEELVVVREKIHGTNFRSGWTESVPRTFFERSVRKLQKFFKMDLSEFLVGSHNTERKVDGNNLYSEFACKLDLKKKLRKDEILYGEIYGPSVQKGYHYGLKQGETGFVGFDIKYKGRYLDDDELEARLQDLNIPIAPILYAGPFKDLDLNKVVSGPSVLCPKQDVREGGVIRPFKESSSYVGRKILKLINPEYLLKDTTEYH